MLCCWLSGGSRKVMAIPLPGSVRTTCPTASTGWRPGGRKNRTMVVGPSANVSGGSANNPPPLVPPPPPPPAGRRPPPRPRRGRRREAVRPLDQHPHGLEVQGGRGLVEGVGGGGGAT